MPAIQHLRRRLESKIDMDLSNFASIQICKYRCILVVISSVMPATAPVNTPEKSQKQHCSMHNFE